MHHSVENRIGQGRVAQIFEPVLDRQLAGDECETRVMAFIEDFQQVAARLIRKGRQYPVIERPDIGAGQLGQQLREAPCRQAWLDNAQDRKVIPTPVEAVT